jgi:hypothetical protein
LIGMLAVACDMKSCQISAGIVPPNTAEKPPMSSKGICPCG